MPTPKATKAMRWDAVSDTALFKCVLKVHQITPNYNLLAEAIGAEGYECTAKALTHRISNIRNKTAGSSNGGADASNNNTPTKTSKSTPKSASKKNGTATAAAAQADTPSSKRKRRAISYAESEQEGTEGSEDEYKGEDDGEQAKAGKKAIVENAEEGEEEG